MYSAVFILRCPFTARMVLFQIGNAYKDTRLSTSYAHIIRNLVEIDQDSRVYLIAAG
jgi:hypothetical protein